MTDAGPEFTILRVTQTTTLAYRITVRRRGGDTVTVTVPVASWARELRDDAIRAALDDLPGPPGPHT